MASFTQLGLLSLLAASALAAPAGQFGGFGGGFGGNNPRASSTSTTTTTSPLAQGTPITSSVVVATSTPVVQVNHDALSKSSSKHSSSSAHSSSTHVAIHSSSSTHTSSHAAIHTSSTPAAKHSSSAVSTKKGVASSVTALANEKKSPASSSSSTSSSKSSKPVKAKAIKTHTKSAVKTTLATTTTAAVVTSSTTKVATSTAASVTTAAVASSGKRGLAYNDASYASLFSSASEVTWAYNWGQYSGSIGSALNYVPLLWGTGSDFTSGWSTAATYEISVGATHLMSFNEPDLSSQSNLSPAAAASAYMTYMQPFAGSAKLGSPAVTNGGSSSMGLNWLSTFFTDCSSCQIDFVPIHWYNNVGTNQDFKDHVTAAYTQTGKPIWVTEFGLNSPATDAQIIAFLEDVIPWMDEQSFIERYSYFMVAENYLIDAAGDALSAVGTAYIS